jgi:NAD(P)-dependent dehydrogenase (short-subunit alcohol dehydrogenase family)
MGWLNGTAAIITGGGSGLGNALVARFLTEGSGVGILERSPEKAKQLEADFGDDIVVVTGDVRSYGDNVAVVEQTVAKFGRLDTFVGCAAVWDFSTSLRNLPADRLTAAFDEVFHTNVMGYMNGAKASVEALAASGGSVILTVSNAGYYPDGGGPLYTASKHAVVGLIKQLAFELAPKIRVNGVAPGGMLTDLRGPQSLDLGESRVADLPLGDLLKLCTALQILPEPADYTGQYVLLASKENARATTGAVINCDGGMGVRGLVQVAGGMDL